MFTPREFGDKMAVSASPTHREAKVVLAIALLAIAMAWFRTRGVRNRRWDIFWVRGRRGRKTEGPGCRDLLVVKNKISIGERW